MYFQSGWAIIFFQTMLKKFIFYWFFIGSTKLFTVLGKNERNGGTVNWQPKIQTINLVGPFWLSTDPKMQFSFDIVKIIPTQLLHKVHIF
jgi:hypothetical protein